jgi:methyl-accepting chemotaxis protein
MTYPAGVKMVDTDFHTRPAGPLAKPGTYSATLTVGEWSMTQTFSLLKDPRVSTSNEALAEQFELLRRIQDKLSDIANGVNTIRTMKRQIGEWTARLSDTDSASGVMQAAGELSQALTTIENELVQVEFTSDGDTLNYREQLFEKLSALPPVVNSADARPTTQSYAVYDKLAGQIDRQLASLNALVSGDLARLNDQLDQLNVPRIGA